MQANHPLRECAYAYRPELDSGSKIPLLNNGMTRKDRSIVKR